MKKLRVDNDNQVICPVDNELVNYEDCKECIAFNKSNDENIPDWIECAEAKENGEI